MLGTNNGEQSDSLRPRRLYWELSCLWPKSKFKETDACHSKSDCSIGSSWYVVLQIWHTFLTKGRAQLPQGVLDHGHFPWSQLEDWICLCRESDLVNQLSETQNCYETAKEYKVFTVSDSKLFSMGMPILSCLYLTSLCFIHDGEVRRWEKNCTSLLSGARKKNPIKGLFLSLCVRTIVVLKDCKFSLIWIVHLVELGVPFLGGKLAYFV